MIDIETLTGSAHGDDLFGDEGANLLTGGGGDDRFRGGDGDDTVSSVENVIGSIFDDVLPGDGGANHLSGITSHEWVGLLVNRRQGKQRVDAAQCVMRWSEVQRGWSVQTCSAGPVARDADEKKSNGSSPDSAACGVKGLGDR